jgi:4-amino-4-deoxy-L-arabinose transferase-like glycosyltransferase
VWERPVLLALSAFAGVGYAWNATGNLEVYYAAAVRSMSMSWHNFFFGAFDPGGTVTVDKLPGAFWVQALFVRVFGVHGWAIVAPQVLAGMASVLVLGRLVRRLAGPLAGILAAGVLVLSPATVAAGRGNVPDTLMILLLLLAADATVRSALSGRLRSLIWAGVLVGLAFQAKMIEAWLALPALALAYLLASDADWPRRLRRLGIAGLVTVAVSLSWMVVVSLWPATKRPYVDGSTTNSIFHQVFVYNGFGRLDQLSPNQLLTRAIGLRLPSPPPGWDRLLTGALGREAGWLIPAALIALAGCLVASRAGGRLLRASTALWGTWLLVLLVVFSASSTINSYYTAALAALLGTGSALAWERRANPRVWLAVLAAVPTSAAYAVWQLPGQAVGKVAGLPAAVIVLAIAAGAAVVIFARARPELALGLAAAAILAVPAVASASIVANSLGPFDTPFESTGASALCPRPGWDSDANRGAAPPARARPGATAGPAGHPDRGRRRSVHLRLGTGGRADRRLQRHGSAAVPGQPQVDDRAWRVSPRDPGPDRQRSAPGVGLRALLSPARRSGAGLARAAIRRLLLRAADPVSRAAGLRRSLRRVDSYGTARSTGPDRPGPVPGAWRRCRPGSA